MPDLTKLVVPNSGFEQNEGLREALHEDFYRLKILDRIADTNAGSLWDDLLKPNDNDLRGYIPPGSAVVGMGSGGDVTYNATTAFTANRVHRRMCNNPGDRITLSGPSSGIIFQNFVLLTNCQIRISGKVELRNTVIYTSNEGSRSVSFNSGGGSSQSLILGRDDSCATGGGAQIITRGDFDGSSKLFLYGGQIIARGNVRFAADAEGMGASIIAGGKISATTNMDWYGCTTGMEGNFQGTYFRAAW